jgi:hypothetical protein
MLPFDSAVLHQVFILAILANSLILAEELRKYYTAGALLYRKTAVGRARGGDI